jgi:hypothetical protein
MTEDCRLFIQCDYKAFVRRSSITDMCQTASFTCDCLNSRCPYESNLPMKECRKRLVIKSTMLNGQYFGITETRVWTLRSTMYVDYWRQLERIDGNGMLNTGLSMMGRRVIGARGLSRGRS